MDCSWILPGQNGRPGNFQCKLLFYCLILGPTFRNIGTLGIFVTNLDFFLDFKLLGIRVLKSRKRETCGGFVVTLSQESDFQEVSLT